MIRRKSIRQKMRAEFNELDLGGYQEPPLVYWSDHAMQRAVERFFDRPNLIIPYRIIQRVSLSKRVGAEYRVRRQGAVFVCKRVDEDRVLIVTVLIHGGELSPVGS